MENRNYTEYYIEYIDDNDTSWIVAEYKTEQAAFERLEELSSDRFSKWRVVKHQHTFSQVLRTPKGRTVEI